MALEVPPRRLSDGVSGTPILNTACGTGSCLSRFAPHVDGNGRIIALAYTACMLSQPHAGMEITGWHGVELSHRDAASSDGVPVPIHAAVPPGPGEWPGHPELTTR